jgi:hypothetical protein
LAKALLITSELSLPYSAVPAFSYPPSQIRLQLTCSKAHDRDGRAVIELDCKCDHVAREGVWDKTARVVLVALYTESGERPVEVISGWKWSLWRASASSDHPLSRLRSADWADDPNIVKVDVCI